VAPTPAKEAVTHHSLRKEKKQNCQDDCNQELADAE
jgi:ribosomal protein L34E